MCFQYAFRNMAACDVWLAVQPGSFSKFWWCAPRRKNLPQTNNIIQELQLQEAPNIRNMFYPNVIIVGLRQLCEMNWISAKRLKCSFMFAHLVLRCFEPKTIKNKTANRAQKPHVPWWCFMSLDPNQPKKTNCSGFLIVLLEKGRVAALVPFCSHHFHFFSSFLSGEEMSHTNFFLGISHCKTSAVFSEGGQQGLWECNQFFKCCIAGCLGNIIFADVRMLGKHFFWTAPGKQRHGNAGMLSMGIRSPNVFCWGTICLSAFAECQKCKTGMGRQHQNQYFRVSDRVSERYKRGTHVRRQNKNNACVWARRQARSLNI